MSFETTHHRNDDDVRVRCEFVQFIVYRITFCKRISFMSRLHHSVSLSLPLSNAVIQTAIKTFICDSHINNWNLIGNYENHRDIDDDDKIYFGFIYCADHM